MEPQDNNHTEPVKEIIITNKTKKGRPTIADEQFWLWFEEMRPFLRVGWSLWNAIEKSGLVKHMTVIYEKYREGGNFAQKIDRLQATISELNNAVVFNTIQRVYDRQMLMKDGTAPTLTPEEVNIIRLVAEKHRTSQTHWVNRIEEAKAKDEDFGKIVERPIIQIIAPKDQIDDKEASQQVSQENDTPGDSVGSDTQAVPSDQPTV